MDTTQIIQRLDEIRGQIGKTNQVDEADKVLLVLAILTERHGEYASFKQHITGREWCARGIKSAIMSLGDLKDLCWEVIEDAATGRITPNVQTHMPFGLDWEQAVH